jgi:hypothetical protein
MMVDEMVVLSSCIEASLKVIISKQAEKQNYGEIAEVYETKFFSKSSIRCFAPG